MNITKLDTYDYLLLPGVIRIQVDGTNDPILVDILSEIEQTGGRIYVEGRHYSYLNSFMINPDGNRWCMDLEVVQIA